MPGGTSSRGNTPRSRCFRPVSNVVPAGRLTRRIFLLLALFSFWTVIPAAYGQGTDTFRPADTSSPRATLKSFIDACNIVHDATTADEPVDRIMMQSLPQAVQLLDCLDTSELPQFERVQAAAEAAICLKEIIDRFEIPPFEEIPGIEDITDESGENILNEWQIPGTRITIVRVEEGPQRHEYLFSAGTVERSKQYYNDVRALPYRITTPTTSPGFYEWYLSTPTHPTVSKIVAKLPEWAKTRHWGMAIWQMLGLAAAIVITLACVIFCYYLYIRLGARYIRKAPLKHFLTLLLPVAAVFLIRGLGHFGQDYLGLRSNALYVLSFTISVIVLLALMFVVWAAGSRLASLIIANPRINPRGLDAQFIRIISRLTAMVLVVILFLEGGNFLGIPLTTLMASAGVGGLAFALAAQDMLKNLFGTIMLLTDKPFRVGERIVFGKYDGVVEDIGLRSTRLRLLTGHQATIPNDELARTDIENVGRRPHIRRVTDIHIPLDTSRGKLEHAVEIVRQTVNEGRDWPAEFPPRIYFLDFQPDAFVVRMMYWFAPADYWEFLEVGEKINFAIFRRFEENGVRFSLPLRLTSASAQDEDGSAARPQSVDK